MLLLNRGALDYDECEDALVYSEITSSNDSRVRRLASETTRQHFADEEICYSSARHVILINFDFEGEISFPSAVEL